MRPPRILQIVREPLKPASAAEYSAIESESARVAAALGCPHPYLGAEAASGSPEVWWFNGYESTEEMKHVADAYAKNSPLMAALQRNSGRKASLTLGASEAIATYRDDASEGAPWIFGAGRFLVVTVGRDHARAGTVFETADGARFIITPARTCEEAESVHAVAGPESYLLAIRPGWSFPAEEWIAVDPDFWQR